MGTNGQVLVHVLSDLVPESVLRDRRIPSGGLGVRRRRVTWVTPAEAYSVAGRSREEI